MTDRTETTTKSVTWASDIMGGKDVTITVTCQPTVRYVSPMTFEGRTPSGAPFSGGLTRGVADSTLAQLPEGTDAAGMCGLMILPEAVLTELEAIKAEFEASPEWQAMLAADARDDELSAKMIDGHASARRQYEGGTY